MVTLSAQLGNNNLTIRISNRGAAQAEDGGRGDHRPDGIGLSNTRRRLQQMYGTRGTLLFAADATGATVTLTVPERHSA